LARDEEAPLARYEQACKDLSESGAAGNVDSEWHVYLAEAYLRRNELSLDPSHLDRAEEIINAAVARDLDTRGIHARRGEILFARGLHAAQEGRATDARRLFEDAAQYYSSAMERKVVPSHSDDYLRGQRGQARFRLYTSRFAESRVQEESILDAALEDLT
jgi:hypothetical protein